MLGDAPAAVLPPPLLLLPLLLLPGPLPLAQHAAAQASRLLRRTARQLRLAICRPQCKAQPRLLQHLLPLSPLVQPGLQFAAVLLNIFNLGRQAASRRMLTAHLQCRFERGHLAVHPHGAGDRTVGQPLLHCLLVAASGTHRADPVVPQEPAAGASNARQACSP